MKDFVINKSNESLIEVIDSKIIFEDCFLKCKDQYGNIIKLSRKNVLYKGDLEVIDRLKNLNYNNLNYYEKVIYTKTLSHMCNILKLSNNEILNFNTKKYYNIFLKFEDAKV